MVWMCLPKLGREQGCTRHFAWWQKSSLCFLQCGLSPECDRKGSSAFLGYHGQCEGICANGFNLAPAPLMPLRFQPSTAFSNGLAFRQAIRNSHHSSPAVPGAHLEHRIKVAASGLGDSRAAERGIHAGSHASCQYAAFHPGPGASATGRNR